ncbi:MAG: bifunctional diaminohydroxyphosphoribosylaminopyrimidine deaminase/5-amino-6-(5-phosphoribosylamino)uracil reductase RibD [Planctomycetes bacterium]|nr:bifunctional diaminohydroxyphosphoribosylaminopyrimidine deaminase/5-amino-6-(5-phosphoribosylamino)uracil reductase RibD [Planctomycetota bacterium]
MLRALELAMRGEGRVEPNPMVGCVIARGGSIVAEGQHGRFGGAHAEVEALARFDGSPADAALYVTLEPCCHHGKTPPCTDAIGRSGIGRVFVAHPDPYPEVAGRGVAKLRAMGVEVIEGVCREEAAELLAPYRTRIEKGRPWILVKVAMSWDGKIATRSGDSRWISGESSRAVAHALRGRVDAVLVGIGTAERDDPLLTARPPGPRVATRVILDSQGRLPLDSRLVRSARETPVLVAVSESADPRAVDRLGDAGCEVWAGPADRAARLDRLLGELARRGMTNVLVEGGGHVIGSLRDADRIDEVHLFLAPRWIGGSLAVSPVAGRGPDSLADAAWIDRLALEVLDDDLYVRGRVRRERPSPQPTA